MKKFFQVLGGFFLVVLLLGATFIGYSMHQGANLDVSSKAYVEASLTPIVATWSKEELMKRASPQLLATLAKDPDHLDRLFEKLGQLGNLKRLSDLKGQSLVTIRPDSGKVVTALYTETGEFQNGIAAFKIELIQLDGQWSYLSFYVSSPILLQ